MTDACFSLAAAERPVPRSEVLGLLSKQVQWYETEHQAFKECTTEAQRNKRAYESRTHACLAVRNLQQRLVHGKKKAMGVVLKMLKVLVKYAERGQYTTESMHIALVRTAELFMQSHAFGLPMPAKVAAQYIFLDLASQLGASDLQRLRARR